MSPSLFTGPARRPWLARSSPTSLTHWTVCQSILTHWCLRATQTSGWSVTDSDAVDFNNLMSGVCVGQSIGCVWWCIAFHIHPRSVQVRCTMPELCVWVGWATAWQPGSCLLTQTNCTTASRVLWLSETPAVRWWYHKSVCKRRCGNSRGSTPLSNVPNCESPRRPKISNDKWSKQLSVHSLVCLSPQAYRWNRTSKLQQIVWCISHDDLASAWQRLTMNLSAAYNSTTISVTSTTIARGGSGKQALAAVGYKLYGHWSSSFTVTNGSKNVATSSVCLYLAIKWNCCRSYDCSLKSVR